MSEFRQAVQPTPEAPLQAGPVQPDPKPIDSKQNNIASDGITRLDIYEIERGQKYATDYFGLRDISAGDFKIKMDLSRIDKYLKEEIKTKEYDSTITNYKNLIAEIESKINSTMLSPQKRLQKIINYISLMQKMQKLEEQKKAFLS